MGLARVDGEGEGEEGGAERSERGGHFELQDTSSFGTFVNGARVPVKGSVVVRDRSTVMLTMRHIFRIQIRTGTSPRNKGNKGPVSRLAAAMHALDSPNGMQARPGTPTTHSSATATSTARAHEEPTNLPPLSVTHESHLSRDSSAPVPEPSEGLTRHESISDVAPEPERAGSGQEVDDQGGDDILAKAERAMSLLDEMICKASTGAGSSVSGSEKGGVEQGKVVEWISRAAERRKAVIAAPVGDAGEVHARGAKPMEDGGSGGEADDAAHPDVLLPISSSTQIFSEHMDLSPRAAEPLDKGPHINSLGGSPCIDLPRLSKGDRGPCSTGVPSTHLRRLTGETVEGVSRVPVACVFACLHACVCERESACARARGRMAGCDFRARQAVTDRTKLFVTRSGWR